MTPTTEEVETMVSKLVYSTAGHLHYREAADMILTLAADRSQWRSQFYLANATVDAAEEHIEKLRAQIAATRNDALEEAAAHCMKLRPELENKDYLTEAWGRAVAHLARQLRALMTKETP
ncbi:MAG: hypothetical protein KGI54_16725 [Pseudomonadota bacterium]|nr:hypothetical protein [Pseudomonadota bacterium]